MTSKHYFIAGTDTDVGKTLITGLLARYFHQQNPSVITQKWIHTGTNVSVNSLPEDLKKHDELIKLTQSNPAITKLRCPYRFLLPASAHLAAEAENKNISDSVIKKSFIELQKHYQRILIEGIGGLLLPFNRHHTLLDIIKDLQIPVILVISNRLGAINHALLSLEVLKHRKITCKGLIWSGSHIQTDPQILKDNPKIVSQISNVPMLANIPFHTNSDTLYETLSTQLQNQTL